MKSMTPFQEALLAATESQFADVPEEEQIQIHPSREFYDNVPGKRKSRNPLRKAILIAAALALFASAAVAARFFTLGNVEVHECPFAFEEKSEGVYAIELKFHDDFANQNAPEIIETFYLPTKDVSIETAMSGSFEVGDGEQRYFPLLSEEELAIHEEESDLPEGTLVFGNHFTDRLPENPDYFYAGWNVDGQQIHFGQLPAKAIPDIDIFSIQFPGDMLPETRTELLQINNYEVLSVLVEWELPFEEGRHTTHHWYWTDGDYFFSLSADDTNAEYMQQLMESVQPMEDMSLYFGEG